MVCIPETITNDFKKMLEELFTNSLNLTYLYLYNVDFESNLNSLIINAITKSENLTYFYSYGFLSESEHTDDETDSFYLGLMRIQTMHR